MENVSIAQVSLGLSETSAILYCLCKYKTGLKHSSGLPVSWVIIDSCAMFCVILLFGCINQSVIIDRYARGAQSKDILNVKLPLFILLHSCLVYYWRKLRTCVPYGNQIAMNILLPSIFFRIQWINLWFDTPPNKRLRGVSEEYLVCKKSDQRASY